MAEYNPSKIIKDGNTYNFRDNTKIPLAGSNQISGSLIPSTDGTVNLGGSSYQWNQAYIKSLTINGVACGDILTHNVSEFVDVASAQTIGGEKTFSNLRTYFGRDISCYSVRKYGKNLNPTSNTCQYLNFSGNLASEGSTNDWSSGYIEQVVDTNGGSRGRWLVQDTSENNVALEIWASGNDKQVRPLQNGNTDLGTKNRKWKTINGIAPDELGLPTSTYTDVSSYITNFDSTPNMFTAPVSGLLFVAGNYHNIRDCTIFNNTKVYMINLPYAYYNIRGLIPVEKGDSISVYISGSLNDFIAKIFHLKGKV